MPSRLGLRNSRVRYTRVSYSTMLQMINTTMLLMMLILIIMMMIMLTWRCTKAIVCNSKMFVSPTHHVKIYLGDRFFIHLHLSVVCGGHNLFWPADYKLISLSFCSNFSRQPLTIITINTKLNNFSF